MWQRTAEVVLRGLNHSLSNRLTVLAGLAAEATTTAPDGKELGLHVEGLVQLLHLYRALPLTATAAPEAVRVQDVMSDAVLLFAAHLEMRDVACSVHDDAVAPPVLFDRAALIQALLLLLTTAAQQLDEGARGQGLVLRLHGEADWVHVSAETRTPVPAVCWVETDELLALRAMVRAAGGSVNVERDVTGVARAHLRLATLARLRRLGH